MLARRLCLNLGLLFVVALLGAHRAYASDITSMESLINQVTDCNRAVKSTNGGSGCAVGPRSPNSGGGANPSTAPSRATASVDNGAKTASFKDSFYKESHDISVLTPEQLKVAHELLKNDSSLMYRYAEGCADKALKASVILENKGIITGRVFAEATSMWDKNVHVTLPNGKQRDWKFHTAPMVYVKDSDGQTKLWVIDPLLGDPQPVEKWSSKVAPDPNKIEIKYSTRHHYEPGKLYQKRASYVPEEMQAATNTLRNMPAFCKVSGC